MSKSVAKKLKLADEIVVFKHAAPKGLSFNRVAISLANPACGSIYFVKSTVNMGSGRPVPPKPSIE